ncbi:hypothetical protein ACQP1P_42520 [Dactylosporangium sp. CA-052675]|uniref:hypothetical protein n=1 Tax=Dactylosporangium sp. CA-052675 TaxID=3239927 RepID=UPI003D92691E
MVVRLVRAGVGALLLLIAVPLALAGGGLLLAMEHRAGDDTFSARLERVRADGTAVVVPDVDRLLRADAPFARGGQTTLSLSAVGSGGPLFIGLAPTADVKRYLDGRAHTSLTHVRLARGPLPVELTVEPANRTANQAADRTDPADLAGAANQAANQAADQAAANPAANDPGAVNPAANDPGAVNPGAANPDANDPEAKRPAQEKFWIARSEQRAGEARLTWSSSALRGKHLALVVMRADGRAGIDAAITARLAPAWLGPTTGGLLMLGGALFFLALITLAWPPARPALQAAAPAPAPEPLAIPAQTTPEESEESEEPKAGEPEESKAGDLGEPKAEEQPEEPQPQPHAEAEAEGEGEAAGTANERVMATLADVLKAADAEVPPPAKPEKPALDECELDRPAPEDAALEIDLPPLPAMPNIELQFTWAPLEVGDEPADTDGQPVGKAGKPAESVAMP